MTVDDSQTIRTIVSSYCKELGPVQMVEACNGAECLQKCEQDKPDLILLDVNMPVLNGKDTLRKLRSNPAMHGIAVVMLTTESEKKVVVELLKMGVQQYIIKPFDKETFLTKVKKVLEAAKGAPAAAPVAQAAPAAAPAAGSGKRSLLVVEDKENIVKMIADAAKGQLEVQSTARPDEAIKLAQAAAPEVVFVNLTIPEMDTFGLLATLHGLPQLAETRMVGMCLKTAEDVIRRAYSLGYVRVLTKPFAGEDVTKLLVATKVTVEMEGDIPVVVASGEPFARQVAKLTKAAEDRAEEGHVKIVFDFANVPQEDQNDMGMWARFGASKELALLGIRAAYFCPSEEVRTKLKSFVDTSSLAVFGAREQAVAHLKAT